MRTILAEFVVIAAAPVAWAQSPWTVTSPDGRTTISVARQADGRLLWGVMRDNGPILADFSARRPPRRPGIRRRPDVRQSIRHESDRRTVYAASRQAARPGH